MGNAGKSARRVTLRKIQDAGGGNAISAVLAGLLLPFAANHYFGGWNGGLKIDGGVVATIAILLNAAILLYGWSRYRAALQEIARRTDGERQAQSLAATDPLTGFLNRRSMHESVAGLLSLARARKLQAAMLVIDLDGFKTVNDLHGHLTGDNLLRTTAEVIRRGLPSDAVLARLGGDQFAATFTFDPGNPAEAEAVVGAIIDRLGKPFDLAGVHAHVSASAGLAECEGNCLPVDAMMRRADIAMSAAKKLGRSRFAWFDASMQRELRNRNEVEEGLRRGIPDGEIIPYFEPQIDMVTGDLEGFEMLARWQHPVGGLVGPEGFIAVAEDSGLIGELSISVMRQAMAEARSWDNALSLSVNISPIQLKDPWLAQKIAKLLSETGFPAERLEIEITESSLFENLGLAQAIVSSLKNQGIRLALDDFGTGYSSLAHLRALPFDRIKIDRSFVGSINENPESAVIVTAITRLAESLHLSITAEGVEDETIEARLQSIGSYHAQGWHFGKPMPIEDVRTLLASKGLLPAAREFRTQPISRPRTRRAR